MPGQDRRDPPGRGREGNRRPPHGMQVPGAVGQPAERPPVVVELGQVQLGARPDPGDRFQDALGRVPHQVAALRFQPRAVEDQCGERVRVAVDPQAGDEPAGGVGDADARQVLAFQLADGGKRRGKVGIVFLEVAGEPGVLVVGPHAAAVAAQVQRVEGVSARGPVRRQAPCCRSSRSTRGWRGQNRWALVFAAFRSARKRLMSSRSGASWAAILRSHPVGLGQVPGVFLGLVANERGAEFALFVGSHGQCRIGKTRRPGYRGATGREASFRSSRARWRWGRSPALWGTSEVCEDACDM